MSHEWQVWNSADVSCIFSREEADKKPFLSTRVSGRNDSQSSIKKMLANVGSSIDSDSGKEFVTSWGGKERRLPRGN